MVPALGDPTLSPDGPGARPILLNRRAATRPTITGVERWAAELLPRLEALAPKRYRLVEPPPWATGRGLGQAWEQLLLPAQARRVGAAIVFSPANLAPLAWPRNVVMVHDAAVLRTPAAYSRGYALWHRTAGLRTAHRALRVLTVSEFSKRELTELAGLDPERVVVIRGGVDQRFTTGADPDRAAAAFGLSRPYVLTVSTADQRKNLAALSPAARALDELGVDLIWAGESRPYFSSVAPPSGVRALGYVPDQLLPGLYAGARAFVLPSRYEGLGLTCLEAMACGTPVVAAAIDALRETCGDAALLADPDDPPAIANAVTRAVTDEALRTKLIAAGVARTEALTWGRAARETFELLERVAAEAS